MITSCLQLTGDVEIANGIVIAAYEVYVPNRAVVFYSNPRQSFKLKDLNTPR